MAGKLSGVLFLRALYEAEHGTEQRSMVCLSESLATMLDLVASGDETVTPHIIAIVEQLEPAIFAAVAAEMPELLLYRSAHGAA